MPCGECPNRRILNEAGIGWHASVKAAGRDVDGAGVQLASGWFATEFEFGSSG